LSISAVNLVANSPLLSAFASRSSPVLTCLSACGQCYLANSIAAARTKSESPLYPFRFAVVSSNAFSSAVRRTFTCFVRVPAWAGAGGV